MLSRPMRFVQLFNRPSSWISISALSIGIIAGLAFWQSIAPSHAAALLPLSETFYSKSLASTSSRGRIYWAQRAILSAPHRSENLILLAYAYMTEDNAVTTRVLSAVDQSYKEAPFAPDSHEWRLGFVFSNWKYIPKAMRQDAVSEGRAYSSRQIGLRYLKRLANIAKEPDAKFAINALIKAREAQQRSDWQSRPSQAGEL